MTFTLEQSLVLLACLVAGILIGYVWGSSESWYKGYKTGFNEGIYQYKWATEEPKPFEIEPKTNA